MKYLDDNRLGATEVVKKTKISPERLRYWDRAGVAKPKCIQCGTRKFRRYSQNDIQKIIFIKTLVDVEGYSLGGAIKKLKQYNQTNEQGAFVTKKEGLCDKRHESTGFGTA